MICESLFSLFYLQCLKKATMWLRGYLIIICHLISLTVCRCLCLCRVSFLSRCSTNGDVSYFVGKYSVLKPCFCRCNDLFNHFPPSSTRDAEELEKNRFDEPKSRTYLRQYSRNLFHRFVPECLSGQTLIFVTRLSPRTCFLRYSTSVLNRKTIGTVALIS